MIYTGSKTVTAAGTAEALASVKTMCAWVVIQPMSDNTNNVYIGDSTVSSSDGVWLDNDLGQSLTLPQAGVPLYIDLNLVYVDADTSGEGVVFLYGRR